MVRAGIFAALVALSSCKPVQAPPAPPAVAEPVAAPAAPRQDLPEEQRSPDLFGAWRVERIAAPGPAPIDGSWDMILLVGLRQIEILSQCVTIGPFDYGRTVGGGIAVGPTAVRPRPGTTTPPQCARALSSGEQAIGSVLFDASEVRRDATGAVALAGRAGIVTLRRPPGALANPRGQAPPPALPPTLGAWRFSSVDGRVLAPGQEMELLLRPSHLEWRSGCVGEVRELGREGNRLVPGASDPFPVCERGRSDAELAVGRLVERAIDVRMMPDGRLTLKGSGVTATLEPLVG